MNFLKSLILVLTATFAFLSGAYAATLPSEPFAHVTITNMTQMPLYFQNTDATHGEKVIPKTDYDLLSNGGQAKFDIERIGSNNYTAYFIYDFLTDQGTDGCVFSFTCTGNATGTIGGCKELSASGRRICTTAACANNWNANCAASWSREGNSATITAK